MKMNKFNLLTAGAVLAVGAGAITTAALMRPEAANPLVWAMIAMGVARVAVAAIKRRERDRSVMPNHRQPVAMMHGEIA